MPRCRCRRVGSNDHGGTSRKSHVVSTPEVTRIDVPAIDALLVAPGVVLFAFAQVGERLRFVGALRPMNEVERALVCFRDR
jgi:hypothetical protein